MKKIIVAAYLTTLATMTWASCTTQTFTYNGRYTTCTTCCDSRGNCTTNCY